MPTTLFAQHQHQSPLGPGAGDDADIHYIHPHPKGLYVISEHAYVASLIQSPRDALLKKTAPSRRVGALPRRKKRLQKQQSSPMATLHHYAPDSSLGLGGAPGSPPDLTNSKSSKSSSFHSSTLSDVMGPSDLSHFEDINLDDMQHLGPSTFHIPTSPSHQAVFDGTSRSLSSAATSRSTSQPHSSFRDLTASSKPRYPNLKSQVNNAVHHQQSTLNAPGRQMRRGFTSPSAPSLASLAAPGRRSRSPSPGTTQAVPSAPRSLSRRSSRNLDVSPSSAINPRRQSWQHGTRKTAKEREAECDEEDDDEVPEDAILENVPISPRPPTERSPAPSSCGSPPQSHPSPVPSRPVSRKGTSPSKRSPARSSRQFSPQPSPPSPNPSVNGSYLPNPLVRQRTNTWEDAYQFLDKDAKKVTEDLEEYQTERERQQEIERQQPGLSRASSLDRPEPKKTNSLPPLRKSDPLIDPFKPSAEKEKYLSRTRPSWLPPKDPKEEKKHLKEYQKMLARIQEAERLEAERQEKEAAAREQAERVKAEYWSNLLLPNWDNEMRNPEHKSTHRKMWWNGVPPKLRGAVWKQAIGNDLEVTETTFRVALEKAQHEIKELGDAAFGGRYATMVENTKLVFPDLKVFAPKMDDVDEQPLHQDLVNVCVAYTSYRPDVDTTVGFHFIAGLFLLTMSVTDTFISLSNLFNRPLPLSFLIRDSTAITAAYDTTLSVLNKKFPTLAKRFEELRVEPRDYLYSMMSSLFCERLSLEHAARVMDVYTIEGDKIPPRVAVGLLGILELSCSTGDVEEVTRVLRKKEIRDSPDDFMGKVYEAGKITSA
ncbi:hypothetical protein BS50DRAFT_61899 [Corynespora cassiicola Philippines]|uniref:Rab-GAP TBC domain-containing protein n=1 Tax=Corynespora cassiicola Philippines TaxID=1448308 RepID=A0A2T2NJE6_CORCC|nr:hypothetical protein BS50DRAFT_61899 [Corynespora cassiicola Philippines]